MAALLETPSRIWRRIQDEQEPSSLPSLPGFEHSMVPETTSDQSSSEDGNLALPVHSTPVALSSHTTTTITAKLHSSTSSTARFATSVASRSVSAKSSASQAYIRKPQDSFDISAITSLPHDIEDSAHPEEEPFSQSANSVPEVYLPPVEAADGEDMSLVDALESISRSSSPLPPDFPVEEQTPKKGLKYDYSVSLRSEPKPSPFDKYRNVAFRKPLARARTPSLSRTTPSPVSSPPNSTPRSNRSTHFPRDTPSPTPGIHIPLPRSTSVSPAVRSLSNSIFQSPDEVQRSSDEDEVSSNPGNENRDVHENDKASEPEGTTNDDHEPTFTSSSDSNYPVNNTLQAGKSHVTLTPGISSSTPTPAFTPTPAIAPRPRPRFNVPQTPEDVDVEEEAELDSDPITPRTRRRSFLLSVINSTARPRMKAPTPHPRRLAVLNAGEESSDDGQATLAAPLRKAFAGATPRPSRDRLSHPLAQVYMSEAIESALCADGGSPNSPYDSAGERMSFVSTASSHDLVAHVRANTSYDPAVGLGERGKTGRFDAQKLNTYLHALNRRLQDENVALVERLRKYEDVKSGPRLSIDSLGRDRRVSAGSALGDVEEDAGAEGWAEEKLELEAILQKMEEDLDKLNQDKVQLQNDLNDERNERTRDKERWRERMQDVEKGVADIVSDLEKRLDEAESGRVEAVEELARVNREAERVRERLENQRDLANERAMKAEHALESGKELGGALREANSKVSMLTSEVQAAAAKIGELEETVVSSERCIDQLKQELKEERLSSKLAADDFHGQLGELGTEVMRATARIAELDKAVTARDSNLEWLEEELQLKADELLQLQQATEENEMDAVEEIRRLKQLVAELEESGAERAKLLKEQLSIAHDRIAQFEAGEIQANDRIDMLQKEAGRTSELARQLEEALEAAEEKMRTDEEVISELKGRLITLEREQERQQALGNCSTRNEAEEALEADLDEAHKEIARLNALLQQSPVRKAVDKAKDARIEMLEQEREDLLERIKALRTNPVELTTPNKIFNMNGISPIHRHVLSMSVKAPKTPGAPLRDLSWLNATTADPTVSPLLTEIARLQTRLDHANESIDQKLNQLEEAGLDVVGLTKSLQDTCEQLATSEREVARLQRREQRRLRRLERLRCQKCLVNIDLGQLRKIIDVNESTMDMSQSELPSHLSSPATNPSEAFQVDLQNVYAQLDAMKQEWQEEKRRLLGEKAVLEDEANRMKMEARNAKEEFKKANDASRKSKADSQKEVEKAKATISDLETELQVERMRLRQMSTEHHRLQREREDVARQIQRTEADIEDVKRQLHKAKRENHELENELRENANVEQKARLLEARVRGNAETIEQLRQERSLLARDYKDLQRQFAEVSERAGKARAEYAASQTSHDGRRQQLDACLTEIDELRRALANSTDELQRTEQEKNRIIIEKTTIVQTIDSLEAELKRVRKDAAAIGLDLKALKTEKQKMHEKHKEEMTKAERAKKQSQAQIRLLTEQLENHKAKTKKAREDLLQHVCPADDQKLEALKAQHKQECKGLIVQIRYLKAKFTRESTLRDDLAYQKRYLLVLLASFEESEKRILACIARIGYPKQPQPVPVPERKTRQLRSVALCVVFVHRIK
ncbi:hypothetical protein F5141DRAFT_1188202 [Pisolithus sp. B1]|nr:hypothetical protein F5141DRAFT_1188202 [Pisolithus sp. B1]